MSKKTVEALVADTEPTVWLPGIVCSACGRMMTQAEDDVGESLCCKAATLREEDYRKAIQGDGS